MVWNSAIDHGILNTPCPTKSPSFRLPKVDNERQRYLTLEEEMKLLEKVKERSQQAHDITLVGIDAGLRFGEIADLTWGCVDLENPTIRVLDTKTGKGRNVPMTDRLVEFFQSLPGGLSGELVFPSRRGTVQSQVPSSFKRGVEDAKLNEGVESRKLRASFYTLRHTFATRLP